VGPGDGKVFHAFVRRGWDPTETIPDSTVMSTIWSSLFGVKYRTSPVSALYLDGRKQDIALQKARGFVDKRNHLRFWLTPLTYEGKEVWIGPIFPLRSNKINGLAHLYPCNFPNEINRLQSVGGRWVGQISRDIGVRLSSKTITTHKIDPDVDETRDYLLQDLLLSGGLAGVGYVKGVGPATPEDPRYNYTLDPYFTDGLRAVLFVSEGYVSPDSLELLPWESPPAARQAPISQ
jgi:hypothetical protein